MIIAMTQRMAVDRDHSIAMTRKAKCRRSRVTLHGASCLFLLVQTEDYVVVNPEFTLKSRADYCHSTPNGFPLTATGVSMFKLINPGSPGSGLNSRGEFEISFTLAKEISRDFQTN